jgi:hypothetical protein
VRNILGFQSQAQVGVSAVHLTHVLIRGDPRDPGGGGVAYALGPAHLGGVGRGGPDLEGSQGAFVVLEGGDDVDEFGRGQTGVDAELEVCEPFGEAGHGSTVVERPLAKSTSTAAQR